jgi:Uma2 family endonuclease
MAVERMTDATDERPPRIWQIPVETYHRMIDCGALGTGDRCELLDGFLIAKWPEELPAPSDIVDLLWCETRWGAAGAKLWPISVDKYHQMIDGGVFQDERVELIDGVLVEMSPQSKEHVHAIHALMMLLVRVLSDQKWSVRVQAPLTLPRWEPEPDIAVVSPSEIETAPRHPRTAALVVEVAASSRTFDRFKAAEYAEVGVTEYWIVDVARRCVEVRRDPNGVRYETHEVADEDAVLRPLAFPEIEVRVADLMLP